jgi:hypothetical protein
MFFQYISFPIFLISLAIGLFYVYLSNPEPKVIYVYPTPENINQLQFKDKASNCFEFKASEVKCPKDTKLIHKIPIQN